MKEINEIKEVQSILYDALCYFDDFCNNNNIEYFLSNGTLLGAAKYGGFIPWDDDIDVLIPRSDYDKLMKLPQINNVKYRLLCVEQVPDWRMPYAKLSCEETIVEEGEYNFGVPVGLSVDIFPIDNWSHSRYMAKLQALNSECMKRLLVCSIGGGFCTKKTGIKRFILKLLWEIGQSLGYERLQTLLLRNATKSNCHKSKYVGCRAWTCHVGHEIFPRGVFKEKILLDFKNRKFPVVKNYEKYLSALYGNWKADLPIDEQHSNHDIRVWYRDVE